MIELPGNFAGELFGAFFGRCQIIWDAPLFTQGLSDHQDQPLRPTVTSGLGAKRRIPSEKNSTLKIGPVRIVTNGVKQKAL